MREPNLHTTDHVDTDFMQMRRIKFINVHIYQYSPLLFKNMVRTRVCVVITTTIEVIKMMDLSRQLHVLYIPLTDVKV